MAASVIDKKKRNKTDRFIWELILNKAQKLYTNIVKFMMKKRINLFLRLLLTDKIKTLDVAGFIANRIAFNRQKSFSRFIIRLSIGATIVSVAVMIMTLALVNGFQETVSNKVFSFSGHISVQYKQALRARLRKKFRSKEIQMWKQLLKMIARVKSMHPYATRYAILKSGDAMEGVLLKGLNKEFDVDLLKPFLKEGRWINFKDSSYAREIIVSAYTAKQLTSKTER